ncbi:MAG TPA: replicative DNA helicase [Flavobacteriales bacterium]|nr:replicative DNA helicase [Flavobacteriales bacterium]MCB9199908.1 replicative DNA helicase [Flavobacteriales bacterium]HOP42561.1 replicative DNA helicase [Flavobacteriales bacterium]HPJ51653.1 replicative DNA helicase [Flavobacteriales bacterium]HPQ57888.1 replicative DNA helicase [Flavobacteriales bacterium]
MADPGTKTERKRRSSPLLETSFEMGKLPPQAPDLEQAVLGAMMLEKNAVNEAIDILSPDSFYVEAHRKIFGAIQELFRTDQPIDLLTVTNELKKRGELEVVGGPFYISQLTNKVASSANVQYHARIISQKHILRELIRISAETNRDAYDDTTDVFDLLDKTEQDLYAITSGNLKRNYEPMSDLIQDAIANIENAKNRTGGVSGVPTGFTRLDKITAGWQKSDMIIVAARPGMGKTAFVLSMARNIAVEHKRAVAVFSLEMSSTQLVTRLIASEAGISSEKLRKGELSDAEFTILHQHIARLTNAPIYIDDTPGLNIFELRAKCRRLKAQHNVELIIIDYLQLMTGGGENKGNREQEISQISRSIKSIAKELDVPIIALSQLSRAVETRGGDKRPMLSDLRESGAIEQDADLVCFIYRPEYYKIFEDHYGSTLGVGEIIVAKHRNGALDTVLLRFIADLAKFADLETVPGMMHVGAGEGDGGVRTITRPSKMNDDDDEPAPF